MKVYRSRRSILLGLFLWAMLLLPFLAILPASGEGIIFNIVYSLIIAFVAVVWFGIKYVINDKLLWIMIGPVCLYKISIGSIETVHRSYSPLSSPAASLRRVRVKFTGGTILISPNEEKQFIAALKEVNPTIYSGISSDKENESILTRFVYSIL